MVKDKKEDIYFKIEGGEISWKGGTNDIISELGAGLATMFADSQIKGINKVSDLFMVLQEQILFNLKEIQKDLNKPKEEGQKKKSKIIS